jgi:transposase-like protein
MCRLPQGATPLQHYLWKAVDQDGAVVDVYLQARRDGAAVTTRLKSGSSKDY